MSETKEHWCLGPDDTGEITVWDNFAKLKSDVDDDLVDVHLVSGSPRILPSILLVYY